MVYPQFRVPKQPFVPHGNIKLQNENKDKETRITYEKARSEERRVGKELLLIV